MRDRKGQIYPLYAHRVTATLSYSEAHAIQCTPNLNSYAMLPPRPVASAENRTQFAVWKQENVQLTEIRNNPDSTWHSIALSAAEVEGDQDSTGTAGGNGDLVIQQHRNTCVRWFANVPIISMFLIMRCVCFGNRLTHMIIYDFVRSFSKCTQRFSVSQYALCTFWISLHSH